MPPWKTRSITWENLSFKTRNYLIYAAQQPIALKKGIYVSYVNKFRFW